MNFLKKTGIYWIGSLVFLVGCWGGIDVKSMGFGPWPIYDTPPDLSFTQEEADFMRAFKEVEPKLYKKLQNQMAAWKSIVLTHNKNAIKLNTERLKSMGYESKDLEAIGYKKDSKNAE